MLEYGSLNVGNVLVGLVFYQENRYMDGRQLALALSGTGVILLGIAVGRLPGGQRQGVQPVKV